MKFILITALIGLSLQSFASMRKLTKYGSKKLPHFYSTVKEAQTAGESQFTLEESSVKKAAGRICNKQSGRSAKDFQFEPSYVEVKRSWIDEEPVFSSTIHYKWSCTSVR